MNVQSHIARSADGVSIHYDVQGNGTPALVFVHGWCCTRHVWDRQMGHFGSHYTVVSLDLAGHGASGQDRTRWTTPAFGRDVVAVVEQLGLGQIVLVGHSMGGAVIVEAARHLSAGVIGLVGADTWHDVERVRTPEEVAEFLAPFRTDFVEAMRALVRAVSGPTSDSTLVEDIVTTMSVVSPQIATGAWEGRWAYDRVLQERLRAVRVPKVAINSTYPLTTNVEAAKHCGIEVVSMSGVGHFVMMEDPQTFNRLLDKAVRKLIQGALQ